MQTFTLYQSMFTSEPFAPIPTRKTAQGVVEADGTCRLTFLSKALTSPQLYASLDQLQQVHCGDGSRLKLVLEP